jgi:hypothetical protein
MFLDHLPERHAGEPVPHDLLPIDIRRGTIDPSAFQFRSTQSSLGVFDDQTSFEFRNRRNDDDNRSA